MTIIELVPDPVTAQMRAIEAELGFPIREVVAARLRQHRSYLGAARSLGVSHETLRQWCKRLGIEVRHVNRQPLPSPIEREPVALAT